MFQYESSSKDLTADIYFLLREDLLSVWVAGQDSILCDVNHHPGCFLWSLISTPDSVVAPEGKVKLKKRAHDLFISANIKWQECVMLTFC